MTVMKDKNNETANEVDVPAVGEKITIGASDGATGNDTKPGNDRVAGSDVAEGFIPPARPRRRKRLRSANEGGDSPPPNRDGTPKAETPPREEKEPPKQKGEWRKKYGDYDSRELICTTVASYLNSACVALSDYIVENGGKPVINLSSDDDEDGPTQAQTEWARLLVLAVDDVLPPGMTASPALIAATGGGALLVQGAWTARKVAAKKKPAERSFKSEPSIAEVKSEPIDSTEPPVKPKPKKEGRSVDKEGNVIV